eukprot:TRINITY_DN5345_c0_g1_i3.p1 TRINITY_DN5345_c0_g1~~TRINITY_DN5345_c0_g1_i3.p1  ORF type:complete len:956 (-),score=144.44 TRINITY_DN5345_c0_g1_i3:563-3430(-)
MLVSTLVCPLPRLSMAAMLLSDVPKIPAAKWSSDDRDLEALENLARQLSSAEAERIAALECTSILQRRLFFSASSPLGVDVLLGSRWHPCGMQTVLSVGKENESPCGVLLQCDKASQPLPRQEHQHEPLCAAAPVAAVPLRSRAAGAVRVHSPQLPQRCRVSAAASSASQPTAERSVGAGVSEESCVQSELNAISRQTGALRARCAQRRESSARLEAELCHAGQLKAMHFERASALRRQLEALQDDEINEAARENSQVSSFCSDRSAGSPSPSPCVLQQACAALHENIAEIQHLDSVATEIWASEFRQEQSLREEHAMAGQELDAREQAEINGAERVRAEISLLENRLANEETSTRELRMARCEHTSHMAVLQAGSLGTLESVKGLASITGADILSSGQVCASQSELDAQRSAMMAVHMQRGSASAELASALRASAGATCALAAEEAKFRARSEWLNVGLGLEETAAAELREQVKGEERAYRRLAGRLRLKDQWVNCLRKERTQRKVQQKMLTELECRVMALNVEAEQPPERTVAPTECSSASFPMTVESKVQRAVSEAETARILVASVQLLEKRPADAESMTSVSRLTHLTEGSTDDLCLVASSVEAVSKKLREESRLLVAELAGVVATSGGDAEATSGAAGTEEAQRSVNQLLCSLRASLRCLARVASHNMPRPPSPKSSIDVAHGPVACTFGSAIVLEERQLRIQHAIPPRQLSSAADGRDEKSASQETVVEDARGDVALQSQPCSRSCSEDMILNVPQLGRVASSSGRTAHVPATACAASETRSKPLDRTRNTSADTGLVRLASSSAVSVFSTPEALAVVPPLCMEQSESHIAACAAQPQLELQVERVPHIEAATEGRIAASCVRDSEHGRQSRPLVGWLARASPVPPMGEPGKVLVSYPESLSSSPVAVAEELRLGVDFCEQLASPPPLPILGRQGRCGATVGVDACSGP